jgi:hypothetical protein
MLPHLIFLLPSVQAADTVLVTERICQACRISTTVVATLATDSGGAIDRNPVVARDARGNYWVTSERARGTIDVFDPRGRRLRSIGRTGSGPGEFRHIGVLAASPSGIEAFDWDNGRWTTIGLDYRVVKTQAFTERIRSAVFTRSNVVVAANVGTREAIGKTLHLIDTAGKIIKSFSAPPLRFQPSLPTPFFRNLSLAADSGAFWSAHFGEYAFERCDFATTICVVYDRAVPWFPPGLATSSQVMKKLLCRSSAVCHRTVPMPCGRRPWSLTQDGVKQYSSFREPRVPTL